MLRLYRLAWAISICIFSSTIHPGLPAGIPIATLHGPVLIETLSKGDTLTGYNKQQASLVPDVIEEIIPYQSPSLVAIHTTDGTICASPDQLFYDASVGYFVHTKDLSTNSILISRDFKEYICTGTELRAIPTECYDIRLKYTQLFFSSDLQILTHNLPLTFPITACLAPLIEYAGTVIACLDLKKPYKLFATNAQAEFYVAQEVKKFCERYSAVADDEQIDPATITRKVSYNPHPPTILGIQLDPKIYHAIKTYPLLYGPLCLTGSINNEGVVDVHAYVVCYDSQEGNTRYFKWQEVGKHVLDATHAYVKNFVQAEDRKQLADIKQFLKQLDAQPVSQQRCFEKNIYNTVFSEQALRNMVRNNIPPSRVVQIIACGSCIAAHNPQHHIYIDNQNDIMVVIEKESKKILNLGHYATDADILNPKIPQHEQKPDNNQESDAQPEKEKLTVEDILRDAKPGEKKRSAKQFEKSGGLDKALEDFESLTLTDIKDIDKGKVGKLSDDIMVNVRSDSSAHKPTLEIYNEKTGKSIKIRYNN